MPRLTFASILVLLCISAARAADDDWKPIFDGSALDGWIVEGTKSHKVAEKDRPVWTVDDGAIHCEGKGFGFLRYPQKLDDFVVRFEYRLNKGANSGVGIRTVEFTGKSGTRPSFASYEIQLLDDAGKAPSKGSSGSLYRYVAPTANATKPSPQWNAMEIECRGPRIRVTLNGQMIQDVDQSTIDEIKKKPLGGYFCLQNHGSKVWFRNIELKRLDP